MVADLGSDCARRVVEKNRTEFSEHDQRAQIARNNRRYNKVTGNSICQPLNKYSLEVRSGSMRTFTKINTEEQENLFLC